jgi:uncharacterized protein YbbK (DUF523 family)
VILKPKVGVSQWLLGDTVRYDGKAKPHSLVIEKLSKIFELTAVCPEVEAGLGVPRPPVQLTGSINSPRLTGRDDDSIDITETMREYCLQKTPTLNDLKGFIFKSRSPSCGLRSTPVFIDGQCVSDNSRGIFATSMCKTYPDLLMIEDTDLDDPELYQQFVSTITAHK